MKRLWLTMATRATCAYLLVATMLAFESSAGVLQLTVLDERGDRLPCRVLLRHGEKSLVPDRATAFAIFPDTWFYSAGRTEIGVPDEGELTLRVESGLEFQRVLETLVVAKPKTEYVVKLRRWVNMKERGYSCGENHVHLDSVSLAPMLIAEGLDFGSSLTWWRGPDERRPVPIGSGRIRLLEFAGRRIPTSIYDAELEYDWGAAYIQNLPNPMPLVAEPDRPNLDYLRPAVDGGALVHYQGGWSREVLLDALMGCVHVVNVCNNNFGLHRYQPRSRYSNLLRVERFPTYPDTDEGMMHMNQETYYRLLNCGLRLAAGAGTATGVKKAPVGYNRTYVRVPHNASLHEFNELWKVGRNFVTNGPILLLRTDSGHEPGDTLALNAAGGRVTVNVDILSAMPLTSVQIVVNGIPVARQDLHDEKAANLRQDVLVSESCWIVAHCTARDDLLSDAELARYANDGNENPLAKPSRLRFAHTSPIYVTVGGKEPLVRQSVSEGLAMLSAFHGFAKDTANPKYWPATETALSQARTLLEKRLEN